MDFTLTDDQRELVDGVRKLCEGRFPLSSIREGEARPDAVHAAWRELGEAGVFALRLPGDAGGVGLGWAEAVLVFEELGRALMPGPLVASHLGAELDADVASGERVAGVIERVEPLLMVEHHEALDALYVLADEGVRQVDMSEVAVASLRPTDPLTPVARVELLGPGEVVAGPDVAAAWRGGGIALTAALLAGSARASCDLAVAYAREREQFGRPVGSFQAVKHLLADMLVRAEVARVAVHAAGALLDQHDAGDVVRAVRGAKVVAGRAAVANGETCVQVHGGMGFTWEVDAHLHLRRAWVLEQSFGDGTHHAEAIAAAAASAAAEATPGDR